MTTVNITNPGAECDKCHVSRVLATPSHRLYRGRSREMILHRKRFHGLLTRDGIMMVLWGYCDGIQMIHVTIERAGDPGGGNCPAWAGLALHA